MFFIQLLFLQESESGNEDNISISSEGERKYVRVAPQAPIEGEHK